MTENSGFQKTDWNGDGGEHWVTNQTQLDAMMAVFGQAAIKAAAPAEGEKVLDVGCGAGTTSFDLAARVGKGGHVLGVDISKALIDRARALAPKDIPARFELADASSFDLPQGAFDILFSRFGVMFFDNPTAAFAHMRRGLKPGGRVAFVCWRAMAENDWVRVPMTAITDILPAMAPPGPETPGPFSFSDQGRVTRILTGAGFTDVTFVPFDASIIFGSGETRDAAIDDAVKMTLTVGPLARTLVDQPDNVRIRVWAAVRAAYVQRASDRSVALNGATWIVTARNALDH